LARNGSGTMVRIHDWTADRDAGVLINASRMDADTDDIANELSNSIAKDGQTTITANLPMATFRHTGVGNASARTDYAAYGQVIDNSGRYAGSGGTANAITMTLSPALTAYATGMVLYFLAANDNTAAVTINVNGLGAKAIKKKTLGGLVDLKPGDIKNGTLQEVAYDGTQFNLLTLAGEGFRSDCRLVYTNATTLTLNRKNGDRLAISGVNEQIPSAGVTLSNGGLSADTTYFIYAYMNSGTMTLEASTTGHTEANTGIETKTGASSRTLVGMARTNGSSQFVQSDSNLGVLSYFNRRVKAIEFAFTADRTTTSTSYTEINSEIRLPFLTWGDSDVAFSVRGCTSNNTNNTRVHTAVGIETGGSVNVRGGTACRQGASTNSQEFNSAFSGFSDESEGYHYATVMGKVGAGTGTWSGGTATAETDITLTITVLG
jgi:hypothetical protein